VISPTAAWFVSTSLLSKQHERVHWPCS
jgi:hypothetical protein